LSDQYFDVLIIGAGLAGIDVACRLTQACPGKSFALLERRDSIGGTWDLFRYPGIRSDSDMFSFGYPFRPWQEFQLDSKIRFGWAVLSAEWSSHKQQWTLSAKHEASGEVRSYSCRFLVTCTGYYNHGAGFLPSFPGEENFKGQRIHPQHWPENLDYVNKKVVVIGSGATAVTLVPAMADRAAHVTMLQRSPSYVVSMAGRDGLSAALGRFLPKPLVYRLARKRSVALQRGVYLACQRWPKLMRRILLALVRKQVGNDFDMKHFTPSYLPWQQRVCVVPNGDLFEKLKSGKASIVTDHIHSFTENGLRLMSGVTLEADIVVVATGLNLQMLGGMAVTVDGEQRSLSHLMTYKGVLVQDLPNFACVFGHANTPWTLKVDLAARYLCRLLAYMDAHDHAVAVPRDEEQSTQDASILDVLSSGYVQRGSATLPRQGSKYPWRVTQHLGRDTAVLLHDPIPDRWLRFEDAIATVPPRESAAA
jgi:monooxygenase